MTVAECWDALARIKETAERGDHESAHSQQDDLTEAVLRVLAAGGDDALAQIAIKVYDIEFDRWCA